MSPRDHARALLLALSQAELTGRYDDARALWEPTAAALGAAGVGSDLTRDFIGRGLCPVPELLRLALRCTIIATCSCGYSIDGLLWSHCDLVGVVHFEDVDESFECRLCPECGSTRSVKLPDMCGAA